MKLIDKDALVAEIEKIKEGLQRNCNPNPLGNLQECLAAAEIEALDLVVDSINSIEVKEVDLDKPLGEVKIHTSMENGALDEVILTTKYKAQKGEKV